MAQTRSSYSCSTVFTVLRRSVTIQLLPDERRYQQTKFKKKTCNPVFDETYIFQAPPDQGELLLGLCYKAGLERLTVTVLEARGLVAPPEMGNQASLGQCASLAPCSSEETINEKGWGAN
ncbi:hypothetical protein HPB49_003870 [Dermacentor silvarum]|uniref:Uncharacterized protein n=1 Tax=Dermacentor silvarum TaxID=543639 RepID=A0ACB8DU77_DERSI|nr:hypothetical protein HPB49_003870 [Dermacentor silvarum]